MGAKGYGPIVLRNSVTVAPANDLTAALGPDDQARCPSVTASL